MSPITTHVLDTSLGKPASGVGVLLERCDNPSATLLASGQTNLDGRLADLIAATSLHPGIYQLRFDVGRYFENHKINNYFYSEVIIQFIVRETESHYHVPLLISPFGYSTYRGS